MTFFISAYPSICPWKIAAGAAYAHGTQFLVYLPVVGAFYDKARAASSPEEVIKSKEAASTAIVGTSSLVSSVLQSYSVAALLKLTGVSSYEGAAVVGSLLFAVTTGPQLVSGFLVENKKQETLLSQAIVSLLDTVGLALALHWYSDSTAPAPAPLPTN